MNIDTLIPFGLDIASGQLVDVSSVKRGNACDCICPSCNTPLVARKGDKKEWHFAHRSKNVHNQTRKECEYSFAVSVRLMIRQLSNDGLKFRTPRFVCPLSAFSEHSYKSEKFDYLVTDESLLILNEVQLGVQFCGVSVDVFGLVEGVPFIVFVTYKERLLPPELKSPTKTKCGVVELNIDGVPRLFKQEEKGQYKEVLRRYIEDETDGKTWAYHPREPRLREAAIAKRQSWLLQQKTDAMTFDATRQHLNNPVKPLVSKLSIQDYKAPEHTTGKYTCVMCKSTWEGTSRVCKKCDTHLYTTERE